MVALEATEVLDIKAFKHLYKPYPALPNAALSGGGRTTPDLGLNH